MAISNLETIIDNIEQMIENVHADNRGRIMLPKDTLRQLLGELKEAVPVEIKRFNEKTRELEKSKSKELEQARMNAERIMNEANEMRDKLLNENEQVRLAENRARDLMTDAENRARDMYMNAEREINAAKEKAMQDYDDSIAYAMNFIQNIGNDMSNIMNLQMKTLSDKFEELGRSRAELQNSIKRLRAQQTPTQNDPNSNINFNKPVWS